MRTSRTETALRTAEQRKTALKRLAKLLGGDVELPRLDPAIASVHEFLEANDFHMQEVADAVAVDPTVAAGVVRVANTAHYSRGKAVGSLRDACVRIGPKQVVAITLEVGVEGRFVTSAEPYASILARMWRNAVVTSRIAAELARQLRREDPEKTQVAALFHNIGEMLTVQLLSEVPGLKAPSDEVIAALVAINHERLGRKLTEKWMLPHSVRRIAGAHHDVRPGSESQDDKAVRRIVMASWALAISFGYSYLPGHERIDPDSRLAELGLGSETVERVGALLEHWGL